MDEEIERLLVRLFEKPHIELTLDSLKLMISRETSRTIIRSSTVSFIATDSYNCVFFNDQTCFNDSSRDICIKYHSGLNGKASKFEEVIQQLKDILYGADFVAGSISLEIALALVEAVLSVPLCNTPAMRLLAMARDSSDNNLNVMFDQLQCPSMEKYGVSLESRTGATMSNLYSLLYHLKTKSKYYFVLNEGCQQCPGLLKGVSGIEASTVDDSEEIDPAENGCGARFKKVFCWLNLVYSGWCSCCKNYLYPSSCFKFER